MNSEREWSTGALEEGDCVSVTYTGELGKEDSTPTAQPKYFKQ
ncbi:MAG: hypothetical protein ACLSE4_15680 [Clostridium sp.]